jgi:hypothetical protein
MPPNAANVPYPNDRKAKWRASALDLAYSAGVITGWGGGICIGEPTGVGFAVVVAVAVGANTGASAATWADVAAAAASACISLACLRLACHIDPANPTTNAEAAPASNVLGCIGGSEAFFVFVDIASPAGFSFRTKTRGYIFFWQTEYRAGQKKAVFSNVENIHWRHLSILKMVWQNPIPLIRIQYYE